MARLQSSHLELLKIELEKTYMHLLPALSESRKTLEERKVKNLSRAFSAFVISQTCDIPPEISAKTVIDDFDDKGIDAIYYDALTKTLYIVQSKLKTTEMFGQDEALSFCQGVTKIIGQELEEFNKHVQARKAEIETAIENCDVIKLVIAYVGEGISGHAYSVINTFFDKESQIDERLNNSLLEFDPDITLNYLMRIKSINRIDINLKITNCTHVDSPKLTYFGLIPLQELINLHKRFSKDLYEKNIRNYLGKRTEVNTAIRNTLLEKPSDFLYLHNGVAALCESINPKHMTGKAKNLNIEGISIINGAQTIASAAQFVEENTGVDISSAQVLITLIKSSPESDFGKEVTKARNHQNSVAPYNFTALDDKQENLRRELSYLNFNYTYKVGVIESENDPSHLHINEAAFALSLFNSDPRLVVILKRDSNTIFITDSEQYKTIFDKATAQQVIDSVYFYRYLQERILAEILSASTSRDKLIYKHGIFAIGWLLAKQFSNQQSSHSTTSIGEIRQSFSESFDKLRQIFLDIANSSIIDKGPLAFFKSQADVIPLMKSVAIQHYGLSDDENIKRKIQKSGEPYPVDLFNYLVRKAPQIPNLV